MVKSWSKVAIFVGWDKKGFLVKYEKYGTLPMYAIPSNFATDRTDRIKQRSNV